MAGGPPERWGWGADAGIDLDLLNTRPVTLTVTNHYALAEGCRETALNPIYVLVTRVGCAPLIREQHVRQPSCLMTDVIRM